MNQSSDAAEQIVRMTLEGYEYALKVGGVGAKNVAVMLYAMMKEQTKTAGKVKLANLLKSGKELKVFSVKQDDLKRFTEEAKRYGVLYCVLVSKKSKNKDGIVDIMVRAEDASKINRIVERFKLYSFDQATIENQIEQTRKEKPYLNPLLAKTEKSPQSEHSLETNKKSDKGTTKDRPSVKQELEKYKKEIFEKREKSKVEQKSENIKITIPVKNKVTKER